MAFSVVSWNGHAINDGTIFGARLRYAASPLARTGTQIQVQPPGSWPRHIRVEQQPRIIEVFVALQTVSQANQRTLQEWFAIGTEGELVVNDDSVFKVADAVVVAASPYAAAPNVFVATLVASDPRWRGQDPIATAQLITTSGQGFSVNNPGNCAVDDPVITLRPVVNKAAASGYLYKLEVVAAWRAERPSGYYATELTEGWDHATEVGAGRSLAAGADVRVLVDGVEVPRWFGENAANDANSAATNVWANINFAARRTALLLSVASIRLPAEAGELEVEKGGTLGWPRQGALLINDEVMTYTGRTESNASGNAAFTGIIRGARGTTIGTHTTPVTIYWVQYRIQIIYGNTGATAPAARADLKPLLDLTSASLSNTRHIWPDFLDETYPGRSMQWQPLYENSDDRSRRVLAAGGSPLAVLTHEYQTLGAQAAKPNRNIFRIPLPAGTAVSGSLEGTRVIADSLALVITGVDNDGNTVPVSSHSGALASGALGVTLPAASLYELRVRSRSQYTNGNVITGVTATAGTILTSYNGTIQQEFEAHGAGTIDAVLCQITDDGGGRTVTASLWSADSTTTAVARVTDEVAVVLTVSATAWVKFTFVTPIAATEGEKYWIRLKANAGAPTWLAHATIYADGRSGLGSIASMDFRVISDDLDFDSLIHADDSDQNTLDAVDIPLLATAVPYIALKAREDTYRFVAATLYNETTGQSVTVNAACGMSDELQIRIGEGVAVNLDDENETSFDAGLEYSDPDSKFWLAAGNNDLRFVEAGLAGVNVLVESHALWE